MKYIKHILFLSFLLILINTFEVNATELISTKIEPLNRLSLSLTNLDGEINHKLSSDKKKITAEMPNLLNNKFKDTILFGEGIIKQVKFDKSSVEIELKDVRGYTVAELPYTKEIVIEVFDWNKLSEGEEAYRMALLGLEDDLIEVAKPDLLRAVKSDIADAGTFLGLILLKEGKINSARKNFQFAELKGSSFAENYAALTQIYKIKKDTINSKLYEEKYKEKTGNSNIPQIDLPEIIEKDEECLEPVSHLDEFLNKYKKEADTTDKKADNDFKNILAKDTTTKGIEKIDTYKTIAKYAIAVAAAFALLLLYWYLKWRKKQLEKLEQIKQKTTTQQKVNKKEADTINKQKVKKEHKDNKNEKTNNEKQSFGTVIDRTIAEEVPYIQNIPKQNVAKTENKETETEKYSINEQDNIKQQQTTLEYPSSPEEVSQKANELLAIMQENIKKSETNNAKIQKQLPTVELASRLADEQKKIKEKQLSNLPEILELDENKINAISKKIGIEKSGLETRQTLNKIENDEEEISKLSRKFKM